jgi:LCP family protein required for cell wall assembly
MSRFEKFSLRFLSIVAILLAGAFFWFYQTKWSKPLGPVLQIPHTPIPTAFGLPPTWTPNPHDDTPLSTLVPASVSITSSTPEPIKKTIGVCGAASPMFILAIGSDQRADSYLYGLADVIRLIRVDFVNPKVTVLEIPRDLWVEIPDIADHLKGQDHEKLNQAYLYGNPGMGYTKDPAGGPGLLARTLTLNFGTEIDQYAAVNMRTFEKIVNAVDGIDVTLPETVDGRTAEDKASRLLFLQGTHHLNGTQALTLARIRIEGVFSRADNQDRVLCALRDKLTSPDVVTKIPDLVQSFQGAIQTSLSPQEISQLACLGTKLDPRNIIFTSFPQELFTQDRTYDPLFKKYIFTWDVDYDILREYIQQFNSGKWPYAVAAQTEPQQKGETVICQ